MFSKKPASQTIEALKTKLSGTVVADHDREYDEQRKAWLDVVEQRPSLIVNAATVKDIVEAVHTARDLGLPLGIQNTGHGIAAPCNEGLLLRLAGMKSVVIDAAGGTATIGPGVTSADLLKAAEAHGFVYPSGQVSSVGMIGYTLGGGYGWLGRKLGAACSTVRAAQVVLADGSVVNASETENPDLFWALRGGGGNFGVVTSLTVALTPLKKIFGGLVYYRMEDAPEVLRFYRDWTAGLSDDTSTYLRLTALPPKPSYLLPLHGTKACVIGVCHANLATAVQLHEQLRAFKTPAMDKLAERPYSEMAGLDEASSENASSTYSHVECLKSLNDGVLDSILAIANNALPPLVLLELQHLGGALTRPDQPDMAYLPPEAPFYFKLVSPTIHASLQDLALTTNEAVRSMGDVFTGELSYNWMRGDQQVKVPDVYGSEKYRQLQVIKRKYDPTNLFHLNLNIPPSAV